MDNSEHYSITQILNTIENLEEKKGIEKMLDLVVKNIYKNSIENNEYFKEAVRKITKAYYIVKDDFFEVYRENWERYFEHLRAVANIILSMDNPTKDKVLIALLHDSIEDTDIDFYTIKKLFWVKIALSVQALSKDEVINYVEDDEFEDINEAWILNDKFGLKEEIKNEDIELSEKEKIALSVYKKAKKKRNDMYFSHLESFQSMKEYIKSLTSNYDIELSEEELNEITKNTIDVKLSDRIHNLSTQWDEDNIEKVERKVEETKRYFLSIAKETNIWAYDKIKSLVLELKIKLANYNKKVEEIVQS